MTYALQRHVKFIGVRPGKSNGIVDSKIRALPVFRWICIGFVYGYRGGVFDSADRRGIVYVFDDKFENEFSGIGGCSKDESVARVLEENSMNKSKLIRNVIYLFS